LFVAIVSTQELDDIELQYLGEFETQQHGQMIKDELNKNVGKELDGKIFNYLIIFMVRIFIFGKEFAGKIFKYIV
jgi:hypothetical protein